MQNNAQSREPKAEPNTSEQPLFVRAPKCLISLNIYMWLFSRVAVACTVTEMLEPTSIPGSNNDPLTSGAYNAELSAPDQMTNITAETRPQSYLQLRGQRPSTQEQFSKLAFRVCISVCACITRVCSITTMMTRICKATFSRRSFTLVAAS